MKTAAIPRCEAMLDSAKHRERCSLKATKMRDGRLVCGSHHRALLPRYVGDPANYDEDAKALVAIERLRDRIIAARKSRTKGSVRI